MRANGNHSPVVRLIVDNAPRITFVRVAALQNFVFAVAASRPQPRDFRFFLIGPFSPFFGKQSRHTLTTHKAQRGS
jgi:hypothetical protein